MNYSLDDLLVSAYENFPEAESRPVIGITANYSDIDATVRDRYYKQIISAGGVPVIIPPVADTAIISDTLDKVDGILLTGGGDYNPLWCGEEPSPKLHNINRERDAAELILTRLAYNKQLPILGICRGIQTLAMTLGGHVAQDISSQATIKHSQDADREEATHSVTVEEGSMLHSIYFQNTNTQHPSPNTLNVNSFHHQAVDNPGSLFRATAYSKDGIIEAIESTEYKNVMGVQWHPEWLGKDGLPLFKWLVDSAREYKDVAELHSRVLTLDTHCDTPMFFHEGVDFTKRDNRILVDLHKMTDGRQDATIMVAYLPQPKEGQEFYENINPNFPKERKSITPSSYADSIFDIIESTVAKVPQYLGIARTPADLYANKQQGKKSIMLGIENGLAIEHSLDKLRHFADRGIVYITLCHNGDNDICDSARGCNTHNGVSEFGEQVIKEMNRLGIMVDMSHAGEKSFYDALRNLTDDQLRAIAKKGGVVHTTFYHGFLNQTSEADILDGISHLEHAIDIMGIDHVGIGTDFDGDGGVRGMRDASDIQQFTRQLLRCRYSESDIAKIWGGNWLRVMSEVQKAK